MPAQELRLKIINAFQNSETNEGRPWSAADLTDKHTSRSTAYDLLKPHGRAVWTVERLRAVIAVCDRMIGNVREMVVAAHASSRQAHFEEREVKIRNLREFLRGIIDRGEAMRKRAPQTPRILSQPALHAYDWAPNLGANNAFLAAAYVRGANLKKLDRLVTELRDGGKHTAEILGFRTRLAVVDDLLKETGLLLLDSAKLRLKEAMRHRTKELPVFSFRLSLYLLAPPLPNDAPGTHRLVRLARETASGTVADGVKEIPIALSTGMAEGYVAVEAIKNKKFSVGEGRDYGQTREWKTILVIANPILLENSTFPSDSHGVITADLIVRSSLRQKQCDLLRQQLGWATDKAVGTDEMVKAFNKLASACAKLLISNLSPLENNSSGDTQHRGRKRVDSGKTEA